MCVALVMTLVKRSFRLAGHPTSVALEAEFWVVLEKMAARRGLRLADLIESVDAGREGSLASALRVAALRAAGDGTA